MIVYYMVAIWIDKAKVLWQCGTHILYVNGEYRGDSDLGKLMHDFDCTDAEDMYFDLLAEKTRYLKENPKGVNEMCKVMEDLRNESYAECDGNCH